MDVARLSNEEKLKLSRIYFFAGLPCLPFIWWINVCCFYRELNTSSIYPELRSLQRCKHPIPPLLSADVTLSLIGAVLWTALLGVWLAVYTNRRISWGEFGDRISFNIPPGRL
ncbi:unnamed protein product [Dicrocoelium dendriticum]|nr:unnamed protein product [Dicrocoelium dendriticum]